MASGRRRSDIDWLRTCASYLVVIYHAAQLFDFQKKTYFKNSELSGTLDVFTQFVHLWHMPLFFLLAGWSSKLSLESRGAGKYLAERAQKLLVPLLLGLFLLCAPPRWVELKHGLWKTGPGQEFISSPSISFTTFLQEYYFQEGGISWNHLWFLAYLFTFSVIYLPGFWILSKTELMKGFNHQKLVSFLINVPVVLLAVVQVRLRGRWPGYQNLFDDWANFWFYSIFFIAGFCLARFRVLEDYLQRTSKIHGAIGLLACLLFLSPSYFSNSFAHPDAIQRILSAVGGWYVVCFLLSSARQFLSDLSPPSFWSEYAFPVYIIHEVPLCLVADFILGHWEASVFIKFVFSVSASLLSSLLILSTVVKRVGFFRFLLGMKEVNHVAVPGKEHQVQKGFRRRD